VPPDLYDRFPDESRYKIARHVLGELDAMGDEGTSERTDDDHEPTITDHRG
jgi:hypothetical protein